MKKIPAVIAVLFCGVLIGCGGVERADVPSDNVPPIVDVNDGGTGDNESGTGDNESGEYKFYIQARVNGLNVRSGAGTGYKSLGVLDSGDTVVYSGEADGWYITVYRERKAYLSAAYCVIISMAAADARTEAVIDEGAKLLGHPYVYGAARYLWSDGTRNSKFVAGEFDCSSLTQYAYYKGAGVVLELTTRTQAKQGKRGTVKRGELLFFTNDSRAHLTGSERIGHVAIYLGDNYILHTASDFAVIEQVSNKRWSYFIEAREILM